MQRRKRKNEKKKQKIIILSTILLSFTLITAYSAFSTTLTLTAQGNIVEKGRVIQSWSETSNEDFHTDFYRENVVTATFLDTAEVPSNAVKSWDVSVDKRRGVMAYVTESQTEAGKYDLFIGAKDGVIANEDSSELFYYFTGLTSIDFKNNFDTSNVINMGRMFASEDANPMNLRRIIGLETFNTKNVTNMHKMFLNCRALTGLDLSHFDTSNVIDMTGMFQNFLTLETLDLSHFNTSKVVRMSYMFCGSSGLKSINFGNNFYTNNVAAMEYMFAYSSNLTELNLCSFDTSNVKNMDYMFTSTDRITNVYVGPNWTTANADTTNMFLNSNISQVTTGQC